MRTLFLGGFRRLRLGKPRLAGGRWVGWLLVLACLAALGLGMVGCTSPSEKGLREIYAGQPPGERERRRTALLDTDVNAPRPGGPDAPAPITPVAAPAPPGPPLPVSSAAPAMPTLARSQKPDTESPRPPVNGQLAVKIVARVDGTPILEKELREATYTHLGELIRLPEPERTRRRQQIELEELQRLIERELVMRELDNLRKHREWVVKQLEQDANKEFDKRLKELKVANGFTTDEELKSALEGQGMSLDGMRRQVQRSFMMKEYLEQRVLSTLKARTGVADVRDYYDLHPDEFRTEDRVVWQDLFLDAAPHGGNAQARLVANQFAQGVKTEEDFATLVEKYDCGDSRLRKGVGTGEKRGEIRPPQMEAPLFGMQPGQMTVIPFDSGIHLIRLVSRTYAGTRPFDKETQTEARKKLQQAVFEREYRKVINELRRGAAIVITAE
jgi:peptidyl-prolyl cis-trans isomerase SurA